MNKLVIIGNGFDLAHGLKTSYNDFMLWYLNQAIQLTNTNRSYKDNLISIDASKSSFSMSKINQLTDFKSEIILAKYSLTESRFLQLLLEKIGERNWVDIESEYYNYLVGLHNTILDLKKRAEKGQRIIFEERLLNLNESLNCIKEKLVEYLNFLNCDDLQPNDIILKHIDILMESVKINKSYTARDTAKILFLNFNYTSTIDIYLKKYNISEYNYKVINIHGNLKDVNSIIFGYGDLIDFNYENLENTHNNEFLKHVKHFYYFQKKNFHELIHFIESSSSMSDRKLKYDVHIMGHSCGVSDRMLLNRIFDPSTCKKIKIYYHQKNEKDNDFFEKTQNISRHLDKVHKRNMEIICNKDECKPLS